MGQKQFERTEAFEKSRPVPYIASRGNVGYMATGKLAKKKI